MTNIQDQNDTFRDVLMPRYRDMVNVFREKMWLAEPATRDHYNALIEFVDVWDNILAGKLPRSIAPAIGHTEGFKAKDASSELRRSATASVIFKVRSPATLSNGSCQRRHGCTRCKRSSPAIRGASLFRSANWAAKAKPNATANVEPPATNCNFPNSHVAFDWSVMLQIAGSSRTQVPRANAMAFSIRQTIVSVE